VFGVYVDAVVHNEASFGEESASIGIHPSRLPARLTILNGTGDRRFWLSERALVLENSGPCRNLWLSATCAMELTASDGLSYFQSLDWSFRSPTSDRGLRTDERGKIGAPSRRIEDLTRRYQVIGLQVRKLTRE
jgi:hypothetical protein